MPAASSMLRRVALLFSLIAIITSAVVGSSGALAALAPAPVASGATAAAPLPVLTGNPMSAGLGPTYGEAWCANAASGSSIAGMQGSPLALIPQEAFGCMLARFETQRIAAGLPQRMTYSVIGQSAGGRSLYGVVVNALETPEQVRDFERWQTIRNMELTDPAGAQALLAAYGPDVKIAIYVENNIHGDEEEGADAMMQSLRDLTSTPRGVNPRVDDFLDHAILITVPTQNPDGRFAGTRANGNGFDMNRDWLVQSQPEVRAERTLIQEWIPTVGLATHGYVNPTLIDGLTKPHNPGLEYDLFAYWNQRRLDANQAALAAIPGAPLGITRPNGANGLTGFTAYCSASSGVTTTCGTNNTIASSALNGLTMSGSTVTVTTTAALNLNNQIGTAVTITGAGNAAYNGTFTITSMPTTTSYTFTHPTQSGLPASGGGTSAPRPGPANAEGWDDWGPFYTQTYLAFLGPDSSTLEMCSSGTNCNGRFGSKRAQYVGFWSSAEFWIANREGLIRDQLEMFRRGVADEARVACCTDQLLIDRGWRDQTQDWSVEYPKGYVIPMNGSVQRSNAEANRLAQWLLDNGVQVHTMTADFTWGGTTFPAGSYVVPMNQALRGLAYTTLAAGSDVSTRITQLYAPPGAWSHGLLWGADTFEIPRGDVTFAPTTAPINAVNTAQGGIRGGTAAPADFYSVVVGGYHDFQTIRGLLDAGVLGEMAEASFVSTTGGPMPAGTLLFPNEPETRAAIDAAGVAGNLWFERNVGVTKPATTFVNRSPRVLILSTTATPGASDTREAIRAMWGTSATYINIATLTSAAADPLVDYDVIVNLGQAYPAAGAGRTRLNAFFNRGGGYIATLQSTTNLSFMTTSGNQLVSGTFSQGSQSAGGGIPAWTNVGGQDSPITGFSSATDYLYMPGNTLYFSAIPTGAVVDGRYRADMVTAGAANGPSAGYVAGLWRGRSTAANNAAVVIHGTTLMNNSRYMALAAQVYSRQDAEREWGLLTQAALWTTLTDEAKVDQTITFAAITDRPYGSPDFTVSPTASSGRTVSLSASGACTLSTATSPADVHITGAGSCSITASQAGTINYNAAPDVTRTFNVTRPVLTVTPDPQNPVRQYSDPHPTITAVITGFVLDEDETNLTTVPTCTTPATPASAPAVYPITCSGGVADNYAFSYVAGTFTITKEDAVVTYTGDSVAFTPPGGNSATVLLRATVQDSSLIDAFGDSAPGDVRNATITFKEGSTTLCTSAVTLIAAPVTTGTASCSASLGLDDHVITVLVNGYYTGSDIAIVEVIQPDGTYIAGGGHIAIGTSAGSYAGNAGSKLHFGYHVRYNKSLKNLVGKTTITFQRGGRRYEITTSSTDSLGLILKTPGGVICSGPPSPACWGIADFRAKAKLTDVTNSAVTVGNNLTLQITMTDRGTPGADDSIGITLMDGSTLLFSSDWNGAKTIERSLTGGNLFVN